jgi:hypothetical protein
VLGVRPLAESAVVAELDGELVADPGAAGADDETLAEAPCLEELDELGQFPDVDVLLGDDLAHEDRVAFTFTA